MPIGLIVFNPTQGRYFDLSREQKYDNGIVGTTFPLRQKFVGIGDRKRGGFVERKLLSFGVVLGGGGEINDRDFAAEVMNVRCLGVSAIGDWSNGATGTCPKR
jgi:hypothetical protein